MAEGIDLSGVLEEDDSSWLAELETALVEDCDFGSLRNICKGRAVPDHLRAEVWQICLGTVGKDALSSFDGLYDMDSQSQVRSDCKALVDKLGNEEEDKVSIVSDLETIVTLYCKSRGLKYVPNNGWMDILQVLLTVKMSPSELYNSFYSILNKFIPNDCNRQGRPFHLFRLLLQYHDPELCSYLDTRRVTPDLYTMPWFNSLFGGVCNLKVCQTMWDVIFQHSDPFLELFMGLVILVNARETILETKEQSKEEVIEMISSFPQALEVDDVEDFCSLAQYYAQKTPQSFRRDYQLSMFGGSVVSHKEPEDSPSLMYSLCLSVSGEELLQANRGTPFTEDAVRFFVVDCRPAEQYNSEHLTTAFHLDANLMLQSPEEFSYAVQALFAAQAQALAAGSAAAGEHLCFLGSGREEEDQYVNMVVANILQKGKQYVSTAKGGYPALHNILKATSENGVSDLVASHEGTETKNSNGGDSQAVLRNGREGEASTSKYFSKDILGKLSGVVKSKSVEMKEKLANYIKNDGTGDKHVSSAERGGKRYRNMANVFTIGDDEEGEEGSGADSDEDDEQKETVSLDTWVQKSDVLYSCRCKEIRTNGHTFPSYLLVTASHLYVLREIPSRKGMAHIQARRALSSIVKITSKKRQPELITFKYGTHEEDGFHVTDMHRFYIPTASDATRVIKQQIMKVLDALDS
ncbi:TBC1 domain family member 23 [Plakobranchus ocellatus]|uniref:TBC1 domain family member 23 n=1 Tax=Plakobranchus ocellatus TaxID=259542 RepID=A0AAV3ZJU0_9GAST|nr:TBC1 domain family member 23 [Plakobranchus ocellatus]